MSVNNSTNVFGEEKKPVWWDRIQYMKDRVVHTVPEMDLENARILTESFKETAGEPLCIQKAKAFRKQCREKTVKIWEKELIVGCSGSKMRGGILCADTCWSILDDEIDTINDQKYDPFKLRDEDREMFLKEIKPFWQGRSTYEAWLKQIPEDCRELRDAGQVYINRKAVRGWGETTAGYRQVIEEGIESICETIRVRKKALDPTVPGDIEKEDYLNALLIAAEGICDLAERYAKEAERLAEIEEDMERKQELLDCLWIKFSEPCLFQDAVTAEFAAGYPMFQNVCVGGVTTSGQDAVNDLSYLILQATMDVQLYQPSLSVRYSLAKNPNKFLRKIVELIRLGTGFPAFHNDDIGIRMLMNKGIPLREALDWNPCGCVETNLEGRLRHYTALADINLGGMIEFVMTNGVHRKSGKKVSVATGNPVDFQSYDEFKEAVKDQLRYAIRAVVKGSHVIDNVCMDRVVPALSLTFRDCIENCSDYAWGGAKYNTGNGIILIGIADMINSMAAIRNLVFEEKKLTMQQMVDALDADFEGYEFVQQLCKDAPKYGNDDETVDDIVGEMFTFIADEIESYKSKFGTMTPGILPVSGNTPFGLEVGALPYGRNAWKPLADGVSPNGGTDKEGPGAVLKSVSKIPHDRFVQGTLLNMKIEPEMLNSENGIQQMMALLKSMCSLGVFHVQFNVINRETLLAAQKNPKEYRGLLVRVAGYTAYFTELGKDVQDEIIGRTEQHSLYGCSCG